MRRIFLSFFLVFFIFGAAFAQRIPVVGIMTLEAGTGVNAAQAADVTSQIISELSSWGTLSVVQGSAGAEYIIRGTLGKNSDSFAITALTMEANSQVVLGNYTERAAVFNNAAIFSFCLKAVERIPFPNYLLGTWQSTLDMPDGPVICIIEFRSDRTVRVERYDTWEHKLNNALRYEGYGRGTYSYVGYANRVINVNSRQTRIDATIGVSLRLEETLPDQTSVNRSGLSLVFNGDKSTFNIVNGMLPCGTNHDGVSVYPSASLGFSNFTKIR
jgi:hypothetical protein